MRSTQQKSPGDHRREPTEIGEKESDRDSRSPRFTSDVSKPTRVFGEIERITLLFGREVPVTGCSLGDASKVGTLRISRKPGSYSLNRDGQLFDYIQIKALQTHDPFGMIGQESDLVQTQVR